MAEFLTASIFDTVTVGRQSFLILHRRPVRTQRNFPDWTSESPFGGQRGHRDGI